MRPRSSQTVDAGQVGEQAAVMADDGEGGARFGERLLQPFDRDQVEMVGRLVEQHDVGVGGEHANDRGAARFAAGELRRIGLRVDAEVVHQRAGAIRVVGLAKAGEDEIERRRVAGEIGLLRQVAQARVGLDEARSRRPRSLRPPRCAAASTCPSRCGRPARCARPARSTIPPRRAAARRRASGGCLAIAIGAA